MEIYKPGKSKPVPKGTPRGNEKQLRVKQIKSKVVDTDLPTRIEVEQSGTIATTVPGSVWRCRSFKWDPQAFAVESDELNHKIIEPTVQDHSLASFLDEPYTPMIYGVGGNPDDTKAKLFAAYLLAAHCKHQKGDANPWWINLTGGFDNQWISGDKSRPSLIVLANLTPQSTNQKLEKARDIIETHPDVPRIIVVAGADPFTFLVSRLHVPVNGLAYFCESIIKQRVEII
jgi:hypothetical protein